MAFRVDRGRVRGLSVLALAVLTLIACGAPSQEDQDKDWDSAADLIATSDRIIVATFVNEITVELFDRDDSGGSRVGPETAIYREFTVAEKYKGSARRGDQIFVTFDSDTDAALSARPGETHRFGVGQQYGLFLKGRRRPDGYPSDYGSIIWTGNGEPSIAVLRGDNFQFLSTDRYRTQIDSIGLQTESNSAAPFTLDLAGLERLTD